MAAEKPMGKASPFDWRASPVTTLSDADRKNARLQEVLNSKGAKRVASGGGDLVNSASPAQLKVKSR